MKPLLFLTLRSFVNGLKRSVTSARRLISVLAFLAYYFLIVNRSFNDEPRRPFPGPATGQLAFPPIELLDAIVFAGLAFISLILSMGVFTNRMGFKPADVDVLFPTPMPPRIVLVFRLVRDYLLTLIMPALIAIFTMRPMAVGWDALFKNMPNPEYSGMAGRGLLVGWLLMALVWVGIGYAISLFVNRSDKQSDRNAKILGWGFALLIAALFGYLYFEIRTLQSGQDWLRLANSPVLRTFFFSATFATQLVIGPLEGNPMMAFGGGLALVGIIVASVWIAMTQAGWMYDQAAVRGFSATEQRNLQQSGDILGMVAATARQGKVKAGRRTWVHKLRMQGPWALLWKEFFLQKRGMLGLVTIFLLVTLFMNLLPVFITAKPDEPTPGIMFLMMQGMSLFILVLTVAQGGFIEALRRVDLQKPLPFSAPTIVFFEVASKALVGIVANFVAAVAVTIVRPDLWQMTLSAALMSAPLALLMSAVTFLVIVLFPDVDDPTQRGFRGLMMMLGLAISAVPGVLMFGGLWVWILPAPLAAFVAALYFGAMSVLVSIVSGRFYATFNPSE